MVEIKGKLIDIGLMEEGRGIRLESEGETITITGLTEKECRNLAPSLGEKIEITINAL